MKNRVMTWFMTCALLAACATAPARIPTLAPSPQPTAASEIAPTPTARVLTRADQPAQNLPQDHEDSNSGTPTPDHNDALKALPKVGQLAPDFTLTTLDGSSISLSQLRGKAVLINFWTSWCVACREESPLLDNFYETYKSRGVMVLGVNVSSQDTLAAARTYATEMKLAFPIALDEQGAVSNAYHVPGLPVSFFIDTQGIIRNIIVGQMQSGDMTEGLTFMGVR